MLGRKTIKQNNISLKCFRFFSNLETGESLRGFVSYNLYATSPKPQLFSASFSAPATVAKPQAIVDFRGGWPKERFLTPGNVSSYAAPIGLEIISGSEEFVTDTCSAVEL